jgi:hypothetical protein
MVALAANLANLSSYKSGTPLTQLGAYRYTRACLHARHRRSALPAVNHLMHCGIAGGQAFFIVFDTNSESGG